MRNSGITYTTVGPNSSAGRINIRCPFCVDDPSEHLGVHVRTGKWNCWRNTHAGIPHTGARLVQALLGCSYNEAARIVGEGSIEAPSENDLFAAFKNWKFRDSKLEDVPSSIVMPSGFNSLNNGSPFAGPFLQYMFDRGYTKGQVDWLCSVYDLRYTLKGKFGYRIIIPVYDQYGKLLSWTGRSISAKNSQRYMSLSRFTQVCTPKETLLGLPLLHTCHNPRALLVCEGPFDAMWVSTIGRSFGVYGTCLFGLTLSPPQEVLLRALRKRFSYVGLFLDSTAVFQSFALAQSGFSVLRLSSEYKDPAEMPAQKLIDLCFSLTN